MEDILLTAFFDGQIFKPIGEICLIPNRQYVLLIKQKDEVSQSLNVLDVLDKLTGTVEAPEDWAVNHDHYLYGEPYMKKLQYSGFQRRICYDFSYEKRSRTLSEQN
ncbi:MAG: hypothetical protein BWK80_25460 [Desulfobacteraceae bacterium IS3]|jgi:hypothetical protein|nr:MAG: hypothetical protein BWK80_25460 [Desulfobacteraceae bacterium IS3]